jgi:hypothetical protein
MKWSDKRVKFLSCLYTENALILLGMCCKQAFALIEN